MATVRDIPVKARAAADDPQRLRVEGQALLAALPRPSWPIALDSRGIRHSPMSRHWRPRPHGTNLARRIITDGKNEMQCRRARSGEKPAAERESRPR